MFFRYQRYLCAALAVLAFMVMIIVGAAAPMRAIGSGIGHVEFRKPYCDQTQIHYCFYRDVNPPPPGLLEESHESFNWRPLQAPL